MTTRPEMLWQREQILAAAPWLRSLAISDPLRYGELASWWTSVAGEIEPQDLARLLEVPSPSDSRFLTEAELRALTGHKQCARQIGWLKKHGVRHYVNNAGRPVVMYAALEERQRDDQRAQPPINWAGVE